MSDIFVEVLRLCVAAGLVKVDLLAIDGTKMGADAALDQNRTARWIRDEIASMLADARDTDQAEDQQPGLYACWTTPGMGLGSPGSDSCGGTGVGSEGDIQLAGGHRVRFHE